MSNEELSKSIDAMIDELFGEEFEKSPGDVAMGIGEGDETADEGKKPMKGQDDDKRGAGRPSDDSDVPDIDRDGNRAKGYDAIMHNSSESDIAEAKQVNKNAKEVKKSFEISPAEYDEFMALRKSEEETIMNELRKSFMNEQRDLIKSAVIDATSSLRRENEGLRKSLDEQGELVKAIARKPQSPKSITSVQALEKSQAATPKEEFFSKSDMLDVAEGLFKSGKLRDSHVIELENNGYIYDNEARSVLERELSKR